MNILLLAMMLDASLAEPRTEAKFCLEELNRMHTVRTKDGAYLLYGDAGLVAYLRGAAEGGAILAVYSDEPFAMREGGRWVVSTGLLLEVKDEAELKAALRGAQERRRWGWRRAVRAARPEAVCAGVKTQESFAQHQARLAGDLRQYREWTTRRLKERPREVAAEE